MKVCFNDPLPAIEFFRKIGVDIEVDEETKFFSVSSRGSEQGVLIEKHGHVSDQMKRCLERFFKCKVDFVDRETRSFSSIQWDMVVKKINGSVPYFTSKLAYHFDGNMCVIRVPTEFHKALFEKKKRLIKAAIEEVIGERVQVEFAIDPNMVEIEEPDVREDENVEEKGNIGRSDVTIKSSKVVLGTKVSSSPVSMDKLALKAGRRVCVLGKVFDFTAHEGKFPYLSFSLTDGNDSVGCRLREQGMKELIGLVNDGAMLLLEGRVEEWHGEKVIIPENIEKVECEDVRRDKAEVKRVELHAHTKMSAMDGLLEVSQFLDKLKEWGHDAVAITDHGVVQAIPEFYTEAKARGIKPIFGMEGYMVDDVEPFTYNISDYRERELNEVTYTVLDFETTGLNPRRHEIIEIGAVKFRNGKIIDRFHTLIKPKRGVSKRVEEITGITTEELKGAPCIEEKLPDLLEYLSDTVLVAHNALFDYRFLREAVRGVVKKEFVAPLIDTLGLSRLLVDSSSYSLEAIAKKLELGEFKHHRALDDAEMTARIFSKLLELLEKRGVKKFGDLERIRKGMDVKRLKPYHVTILVKNKEGLRNLYKLVSLSHIEYFHQKPRIPRSVLMAHREGLLLGSACLSGELLRSYFRGASIEELTEKAKFYDFIEIMPLDVVGGASEEEGEEVDIERLKEAYRLLYKISQKLDIPAVMTGDVHFLNPEDWKFRAVLMSTREDFMNQPALFLRNTEEMMHAAKEIFDDENIAYEIVVENSRKISDMVEYVVPLDDELQPPIIEEAREKVEKITWERAKEKYGDPLPELVKRRLEKELNAIIGHNYAILYYIAMKMVEYSNSRGYVVGSRGSVGSSLVATLLGITEVNPLPPHYVCPQCKYTEFVEDEKYGSGYDLPPRECPKCGSPLTKDGHDIPFEVFMGFEGNKVPDIDLNFSGDFQAQAHKFLEELFGRDHVYRAGTVNTIASKTAYGFVKRFMEKTGKELRKAEINRLVKGITGVKRTTGQHPGGLMIIPKDRDVYDFTPVQYPANDPESGVLTTHFAYEYIHDTLVKIDALGHDDPTFMRMLKDITGVDPMRIPMDDKKTIAIFSSVEPLGVDPKELGTTVGTLGIPEFGTQFVRKMLEETKPKTFAELVRISGLSHGTNVWVNNARDWIMKGVATLSEVISCRDDIMNYLIHLGMDPHDAFEIMEKVRKGKGLTEEDVVAMKEVGAPEWFIESCKRIKYLFPKAHATAYVSMAFRIAYFKVHHPLAFYGVYFTLKGEELDPSVVLGGIESIKRELEELKKQREKNVRDRARETSLEVALEMHLRGYRFLPVDLTKSDSRRFIIEGDGLRIPFNKLPGLGEKAAEYIVKAREEAPFKAWDDLAIRANLNKNQMEILEKFGVLKDLPRMAQIMLF